MLYSQEQREVEDLKTQAENDPDTVVIYLPNGKNALIGESADYFINGFNSVADFIQGRLDYYNGDLNKLANEMNYSGKLPKPNHFDFIIDLGNYGDDLLDFIKDSYQSELLTDYLG